MHPQTHTHTKHTENYLHCCYVLGDDFIMYNCHHIKLMKCRLHNYDYINKELNFWWWYFLHSTHTKQKLQYKMEIKAEYTYIQKDIW
jgi:hypothetical protein